LEEKHLSATARSREVEVGLGVRLFYQDEGSGQPVVLVHGLIEDYRVWSPQMAPLSKRYRAVAYSRRFAAPNKNPGGPQDDTVENNVADLVGLVEKLGIAPVHLVGRSYGGLVATYFAYKHPDLLHSLILIEPAVFSAVVENPDSAVQRLSLLLAHPSVARSAAKFASDVIKQSVSTLKHGDLEGAVRILVDGDQGRRGAFEQFPEEFRNMTIENANSIYTFGTNWYVFKKEELRQITVPTLIIRGENTTMSSRYISDSLHGLLLNSEEVVIPRAGHFAQYENPEETNSRLIEFLAKHSS
jgi:pimeloyl-ACP methyl ester carboxylesterase